MHLVGTISAAPCSSKPRIIWNVEFMYLNNACSEKTSDIWIQRLNDWVNNEAYAYKPTIGHYRRPLAAFNEIQRG